MLPAYLLGLLPLSCKVRWLLLLLLRRPALLRLLLRCGPSRA